MHELPRRGPAAKRRLAGTVVWFCLFLSCCRPDHFLGNGTVTYHSGNLWSVLKPVPKLVFPGTATFTSAAPLFTEVVPGAQNSRCSSHARTSDCFVTLASKGSQGWCPA
ncbi:hypothetical protein CSUI_009395 [Cystoisospora suis]|uniref:Secreted protein n=1 Tax=Cystoisospora suis TaxID=483139 RepID=A0A2C6KGW6_9APIC|nr:hypothetical protein CSUI_009395 [Cystoisospora suis]